jgi:hypothetical protein
MTGVFQGRKSGLDGIEGALQIDAEYLLQLRRRHFPQRCRREDAGIAADNVQAAAELHGGRHEPRAAIRVGDVAAQVSHLSAGGCSRGAEIRSCLLAGLLVAPGDQHAGALAGKGRGNALADPLGAAGHQYRAAAERCEHVDPPVVS